MSKTIALSMLLAAIAAGSLLARATPATRPTTKPATRPATTPAEPEHYPGEKLTAACRQAARKLRARLDESFSVAVQPPFVVAGNMPQAALDGHTRRSVVRPANAMWTAYFRKRPNQVITILLLADAKSYQTWAKRLYGDKDLPHFGYYRPATRTMVMNLRTGTGTLVHELTHALIVYDFPKVPDWFNEGLASLHEQCRVGRDDITGAVNWRLPALQKAVRAGTLRPLRELLTRRDFYGRLRGINYAQARYFVMYMQTRGLLKRFYRQFRADHAARGADVKAVEHVFGKPIDKVEAEFVAWVKTLRWR